VQDLGRPGPLSKSLLLSQAGSEMLTNLSRTLSTLRTGACTGLSVLPFDAVFRIVNHTVYPAQTLGQRRNPPCPPVISLRLARSCNSKNLPKPAIC